MTLKLSRGAKSSSSYIATNLSNTSVEDLSRDVYDNLNAIHTALESVRENQTNILEKAYYIGTKEEKPPFVDYAEGLPAEGWSSTLTEPPEGKVVWMSERMTSSTGSTKTLWSEPIVITGEKGEVGAGSYTIISETASQTFPENATDLFIEEVGRKPVKGDNLTFTNANRTQATSREFNGTSWEPTKTAIDGSWLIKGSVTTDSIAANIGITAPNISGGTLQGTTITNGNNFNVDASGNVTAKDANISGTINATSGVFNGVVHATDGSFTGTIAAQSGYLNNVTINENCVVKGTLYADRIVGLPTGKSFGPFSQNIPAGQRRLVLSHQFPSAQGRFNLRCLFGGSAGVITYGPYMTISVIVYLDGREVFALRDLKQGPVPLPGRTVLIGSQGGKLEVYVGASGSGQPKFSWSDIYLYSAIDK